MLWLSSAVIISLILFYPLTLEATFTLNSSLKGKGQLFWRPLGAKRGGKISLWRKTFLKENFCRLALPGNGKRVKKATSKRAVIAILKALKVYKLAVNVNLGLGDAALTALAGGSLAIFLNGGGAALSSQLVNFKNPPFFTVKPYFNGKSFYLNGQCIFAFRIGDIIINSLFKQKRRSR